MDQERKDVMETQQQPQNPVIDYLKKIRLIETSNSLSLSKSKSTPKISRSYVTSDIKKNKNVKIDYLAPSKYESPHRAISKTRSALALSASPIRSDFASSPGGHQYCTVCPPREFLTSFLNQGVNHSGSLSPTREKCQH